MERPELAAPVTDSRSTNENAAVIVLSVPRPRHCFSGAALQVAGRGIACAASRNQNLINKYLLFYGHFLNPAMQTPFPPLANCTGAATYHFMEICKLSNPVLFAGFKERQREEV